MPQAPLRVDIDYCINANTNFGPFLGNLLLGHSPVTGLRLRLNFRSLLLLRPNMSDFQDISNSVVLHGAPKVEKFTPKSGQKTMQEGVGAH